MHDPSKTRQTWKFFPRKSPLKFIFVSVFSSDTSWKSRLFLEFVTKYINQPTDKLAPILMRRRNKLLPYALYIALYISFLFFAYYESWHFLVSAFIHFKCFPFLHFLFPSNNNSLFKTKSRERNSTKPSAIRFSIMLCLDDGNYNCKFIHKAHWSWQDN